MKKPIGKILVLLVALVLVASLLPAAVLATGESSPCVGWSLTLCDRISANFYFTIAEEDVANTKVNFTCDGQTVTVNASETGKKDGNYVFSIGLAAAQMTDTFGVELVTDDQQVFYKEYSVREYAEYILASGNYTQRDKDMVVAMLNYGAAAQKYFGYNTAALAIAGYEEQVKTYTMPETVDGVGVTGSLDGIELHGRSLLFKSRTAIRFYFEVTGDVADYTFTDGNGKTYTPDRNGNYYSFDVTDINPQNLADIVTITVSKGGESMTVSYSPLQYMVRKKNSTTANLPELVQAMYNYYQGAMKYLTYDAGSILSHDNANVLNNGFYFTMADNNAPVNVQYRPQAAANLKLIRDGETYEIGHTGRDTILKENGQYFFNSWVLDTYLPLETNDVLVISGKYTNPDTKVTLNITESYVLINEDGTTSFSTEMPILPVTINAGAMLSHTNPAVNSNNVFYFNLAAENVPDGAYRPTSAANLKLIRDGQTYEIGHTERDTIQYESANGQYFFTGWVLAEYAPLGVNDVLVFEGDFYQASTKTTLNISTSYVRVNIDGTTSFSTSMPSLSTIINAGAMLSHTNPAVNSNNVFYFNLAAENVPNGYYRPTSAANLKLIRNGQTYEIGHTERDTIEYDSANGQYLFTGWVLAEYAPLVANDVLVFEGNFYQASTDTILNISTSYVRVNTDGTVSFFTSMPVLGTLINAGAMLNHTNPAVNSNNVFYFNLAAENVPDGAYRPTSAANLKLIRNGQTYELGHTERDTIQYESAYGQYLFTGWVLAEYAPLVANDVLVFDGEFYQASSQTILKISTSYVRVNSDGTVSFFTSMPSLGTVIDAGAMLSHTNPAVNSENVFYFNLAAENVPDGAYRPTSAANLKLIRDGQTYELGHTERNTIEYESANGQYLFTGWVLADYKPLVANDVLVFEGEFYQASTNTILNISTSYVRVNSDGTVSFFTSMPVLGTFIDAGAMLNHTNPAVNSENVFYFNLAAENVPDGVYRPTSAANLKLIRDGQTYELGHTERDTIQYESANGQYLFTGWVLADYKPLVTNDVLVFEGEFYQASSQTILKISTSYVRVNIDGTVSFSTEMPDLAITVEGGNMTAHDDGIDAEGGYIFFTLNEEALPENPDVAYTAADGVIKLVRGGQSNNLVGYVIKEASGYYYLVLEDNTDYLPLKENDYLIVEGSFVNEDANTTLNISESYILIVDEATGEFSTSEPVLSTVINAGAMLSHTNPAVNSNNVFYFNLAAENVPNGYYRPTSAANLKLIRNGQTYEIGHTERDTIEYDSANGQYLFTGWVLAEYAPLVANDVLVFEGNFYQASTDTILNISTSYVRVNSDGTVSFFTSMPVLGTAIHAGAMLNHTNPAVNSDNVFYFNLAAENVPDGAYRPTSAANLKLIRNGQTYEFGHTERDTIQYESAHGQYFFTGWVLADLKPLVANDILVFEGDFYQASSNTILNISTSYVLVNSDGTVSFFTSMPSLSTVIDAGAMLSHTNPAVNSNNVFYFNLAAENVPDGAYRPTSAANLKLIRNGQTYEFGHTERDTIQYESAYGQYLFTGWVLAEYAPLRVNDVLVFEGEFYQASTDTILNISTSYVLVNSDGTITISTTEPVQKNVVNVVELGSHGNGWTSSTESAGGMHFTAAANDAPYDGSWSLRYTPVSADVIKLIRNGEEFNIANTGAETIVKFSETEYFMEFWPSSQKPILAGDQMIIDGEFYNAANDVYIDIEQTYITFNADGTISVISESDKYIDGGLAYAHSDGWKEAEVAFFMNKNDLPIDSTSGTRYNPTSTATIKKIRDGVTTNVGNTGAETIYKNMENHYAIAAWAVGGVKAGDVLIIEGDFVNASNGYTLHIDKSYLTLNADGTVTSSRVEDTDSGEIQLPIVPATMTIGTWNGSYHMFSDADLDKLYAAGITRIIGIDPRWTGNGGANTTAVLDRLQAHGMTAIIDMRNWDGTATYDWDTSSDTCPTLDQIITHPAIEGFLFADEPKDGAIKDLQSLKSTFTTVTSNAGRSDLIFYVNLLSENSGKSALYDSWLNEYIGNYKEDYLGVYNEYVGTDYVSWDDYALVYDGQKGIRQNYFHCFELMAQNGTTPWYTMLSAGHNMELDGEAFNGYFATPTQDDLRWQMAVAMSFGVQNINHYVFTTNEAGYSCMVTMDANGDIKQWTTLYDSVKQVGSEYKSWENTFMAYDYVGTNTVNAKTTAMTALDSGVNLSSHGISSISASENLLVGVFQNNGNKAYMITNAGTAGTTELGNGDSVNYSNTDTTVTLNLSGSYRCVAVIDQGEVKVYSVTDNSVQIPVDAYEGVFVIPVA